MTGQQTPGMPGTDRGTTTPGQYISEKPRSFGSFWQMVKDFYFLLDLKARPFWPTATVVLTLFTIIMQLHLPYALAWAFREKPTDD